MLTGPDWALESSLLIGHFHLYLTLPFSKFWMYACSLKVQGTSMSFKSSYGLWRTLEVPDWGLELCDLDMDMVTSHWHTFVPNLFIHFEVVMKIHVI